MNPVQTVIFPLYIPLLLSLSLSLSLSLLSLSLSPSLSFPRSLSLSLSLSLSSLSLSLDIRTMLWRYGSYPSMYGYQTFCKLTLEICAYTLDIRARISAAYVHTRWAHSTVLMPWRTLILLTLSPPSLPPPSLPPSPRDDYWMVLRDRQQKGIMCMQWA